MKAYGLLERIGRAYRYRLSDERTKAVSQRRSGNSTGSRPACRVKIARDEFSKRLCWKLRLSRRQLGRGLTLDHMLDLHEQYDFIAGGAQGTGDTLD